VKGCTYCKQNRKHRVYGFTNEIFLREAETLWKGRFHYKNLNLQKEIRAEDQTIDVYCKRCDKSFTTNVRYHLYLNHNGGGCLSCSKRINQETQRGTTESFIKLAVEKWGDLFDYSHVSYINVDTPVLIFCRSHHDYFRLTPYKHLNNKYGCPVCGNKKKNEHRKNKCISAFNAEVERRIQEGGLDVTQAKYDGFLSPVQLKCLVCNCSFSTIGQHFIDGGGRCPVCHPPRSYSKPSREAIKRITDDTGLAFISALTGNEYSILRDKNKLKVDAYNKELNLVIEFYGDLFHGNPILFTPDARCHPYDKSVTAEELYRRTKHREQLILKAGYNLITIWEKDWANNSEAILLNIKNEISKLRKISCV
jgi:Zn finger protein HypA/HybF involved in hydrogenase expression